MNLKRIIVGPLLAVIFLAVFVYTISASQQFFNGNLKIQKQQIISANTADVSQSIVPVNEKPDTIENITQPSTVSPVVNVLNSAIMARSAISIESDLQDKSKVIFDKNSDAVLPIASLTKLMTAMIVLDNYNLSDTWQVDKVADSQDPMKQDVKLGDVMTLNSYLQIMLIESSNKSAYALSELVGEEKFVELMNQKAKEIGLQNTFFVDPTGLDSGDVSTAKDLVKLAEYIIKNYPKIGEISQKKELYIIGFGNVVNTDELLGEIPQIVCSKTGFTTQAKGCLLLVINNPKNNDYLINVVLGADDRFSEMKKLVNQYNATCNN